MKTLRDRSCDRKEPVENEATERTPGLKNEEQVQYSSSSGQTISEKIIKVIIPVTVGCLYTCILIRVLASNSNNDEQMLGKTLDQIGVDLGPDGRSANVATIFTIVVVVCLIIVSMTLIILLIFYLKWHECLAYYLYIPCLVTFVAITPSIIHHLLRVINSLPIDMFTMAIFVWNFTVFGVISVFGPLAVKSPLLSQQFFLIHNSSMLSILIIEMLPNWAPWLLLLFMIVWDLFAVLAPIGPLNLILNMAEKNGVVGMPGIIYSTQASSPNQDGKSAQLKEQEEKLAEQKLQFKELKIGNQAPKDAPDAPCGWKASPTSSAAHDEEGTNSPQPPATINSDAEPDPENSPESPSPAAQSKKSSNLNDSREVDMYDDGGTSIGIGDFVFYSLLVGLTSKGELQNYYTPLATLVSVLFGLILTLTILTMTSRPLPAVPISVALGVTIAYLTTNHVPEFANQLGCQGIFI